MAAIGAFIIACTDIWWQVLGYTVVDLVCCLFVVWICCEWCFLLIIYHGWNGAGITCNWLFFLNFCFVLFDFFIGLFVCLFPCSFCCPGWQVICNRGNYRFLPKPSQFFGIWFVSIWSMPNLQIDKYLRHIRMSLKLGKYWRKSHKRQI